MDNDTLMSWEWVFITDLEAWEKHCIRERACDNLQMCLAIKEKLDRRKIEEAEDMLYDLLQ